MTVTRRRECGVANVHVPRPAGSQAAVRFLPGALVTDQLRTEFPTTKTVRSLASRFTVEVTPRDVRKSGGLLGELFPEGTRAYITFLPASPFSETVAAARALLGQGLRPVPHLAARNIVDEAELDRMVADLAAIGVDELLVIGGSISKPAGTVTDTMQVLRSGVLARHGIQRVGVAGHPEGNRDIGDRGLAAALTAKNLLAAEIGIDMYLVTQFCFAAEPVVAWERRIRQAGNRLPVHVGLAGLSSPLSLLKFGIACGVGPSLKVLRKQSGGVLKLATSAVYYPDQPLLGLARSIQADPGSLIRQVHFFPFGALRPTAEWARTLSEGSFRVDERQDRIVTVAGEGA
jgi:methylenetetrahydrofolate reductase (NADPH)